MAWDYLVAIDRQDAAGAADYTDDPVEAKVGLDEVFDAHSDDKVRTELGEVQTKGEGALAKFGVTWTFEAERSWKYQNTIELKRLDGRWRVHWTPAVVHPKLGEGQHLAVVVRSGGPAVVDAEGKAFSPPLGPPLAGPTAQFAALPDSAEAWTVLAVDRDGKRVRTLRRADRKAAPLRSTLSGRAQRAAQAAVESVNSTAALVAIRPSTGEILAVAQSDSAQTPIALSGLYPPGSTFKIATATAVLGHGAARIDSVLDCPGTATIGTRTISNDGRFELGEVPLRTAFAQSCNTTFARLAAELPVGALASAADRLGLNADFTVPGVSTETGAVHPALSEVGLVEDSIGQGEVRASPFGVALMSATVAAGRAVTPQLWQGVRTQVNVSYQAPSASVLTALRAMMRETVASGTARALGAYGPVHGKTGTAEIDSAGTAHGWFTGFRDDLAFAVLVERVGSSKPAVNVTAKFLGGL